uniref:Uncharacterized protein n=1 Tax=Timema genevievae TaxID=629358 RepID=A0A7R9JVD3_TIMGE|nr:unnamed protein product [Timema genevievae]
MDCTCTKSVQVIPQPKVNEGAPILSLDTHSGEAIGFLGASTLGPALSGDLSTLFDVGGIVGGIAAGVVSDYTGMYATTCSVMLTFAAPMLFVYEKFGTNNLSVNIILLLIAGLLVNGPYALITTAVSAELGTHHSLQGNSKALATVTAIIDGTGSIDQITKGRAKVFDCGVNINAGRFPVPYDPPPWKQEKWIVVDGPSESRWRKAAALQPSGTIGVMEFPGINGNRIVE